MPKDFETIARSHRLAIEYRETARSLQAGETTTVSLPRPSFNSPAIGLDALIQAPNRVVRAVSLDIPSQGVMAAFSRDRRGHLGLFSLGVLEILSGGKQKPRPRIHTIPASGFVRPQELTQLSYGYDLPQRPNEAPCLQFEVNKEEASLQITWYGIANTAMEGAEISILPISINHAPTAIK